MSESKKIEEADGQGGSAGAAVMLKATVCAYSLPDGARIEAAGQCDNTVKWAVRLHGSCLGNNGEWEYEPMPSSRGDDFLARCRYRTAESAYSAWEAA